MSTDRLTRALDTALLSLPDGTIGVWNAPGDLEIGRNFVASQSLSPVYQTLHARGIKVDPTPNSPVGTSIVFCHRAKEETLSLLHSAFQLTAPGGFVVLDGAKTDGVDSIIRQVRDVVEPVEVYAKAHGKLAWFIRGDQTAPASWKSDWRKIDDGFVTWPGTFSSDGPDAGSQLLADTLPPLKGHVADLGAGWGYLSRMALERSPEISAIDLIEADFHGAEAARQNVTDPRATVIWGDALAHDGSYDVVICNPPFHVSRKPDPGLGQAFINAAARMLAPRGTLWLVANQTLPYESTFDQLFWSVKTVTKTPGFKVLKGDVPQVGKSTARQRKPLPLS